MEAPGADDTLIDARDYEASEQLQAQSSISRRSLSPEEAFSEGGFRRKQVIPKASERNHLS